MPNTVPGRFFQTVLYGTVPGAKRPVGRRPPDGGVQMPRSPCTLRFTLILTLVSATTAMGTTIANWVGGTAACPTCWSQPANWDIGIFPNGNINVVNPGSAL